MERNKRIFVRK